MSYRISKDILYERAIENGLKMSYNNFSKMLGPIEYVDVKTIETLYKIDDQESGKSRSKSPDK